MGRLQVCVQRGCPTLTDHTRCSEHDREQGGWRRSGEAPAKRITGRRLQAIRWRMFADEPFCRACKRRLSAIRDHIIPLAEGGQDAPENTQPLCQSCSDVKTKEETRRGQRRAMREREAI